MNTSLFTDNNRSVFGKLVLLVAGQLLLFLTIAIAIDLFSNPVFRNQFFGHVGPAILLVLVGVLALNFKKLTLDRLVLLEAYAGIAASVFYIIIDTFISHPPLGIFDGAGVAEQQHVGIMLLIGAGGFLIIGGGGGSIFHGSILFVFALLSINEIALLTVVTKLGYPHLVK